MRPKLVVGSTIPKGKAVASCEYLQKLQTNKAKLYDTIVTITIDGTEETFSIHRGLITHYSGLFHTAFNSRFSEGSTGTCKLPKSDRFAFGAFFRWLYQGEMFENQEAVASHRAGIHDDLYKVYVFADFRVIPALKNAVIDLCIENFTQTQIMPSPSAVTKIWQKCPKGDGIRKLLLHFVTKTNSAGWSDTNRKSDVFFPETGRGHLPEDFLYTVCRKLVDAEQLREPRSYRNYWRTANKCAYHDHSQVTPTGVVIDVEEAESKAATSALSLKLTLPKRKFKADAGAPVKRTSSYGRFLIDTDAYQQAY